MNQSLIRWKKGDYIKLGRAVSDFNKRVKRLQANEVDYLPKIKNYQKLKENIVSRKEFNRVINSLKRFNMEGATDLYTTEAGARLTKWEYRETIKARNRAIKNLRLEQASIEGGIKSTLMGDKRIREIEATIKNLNKLDTSSGYEFKRIKERTEALGNLDLELKRAITYRQNYMNALSEMSGYDNYNKLIDELNKIKNPIKFYEYIRKSNVLSDLFIYYKDKATSQTYGGFTDNQDAFNYALNVELEIDI